MNQWVWKFTALENGTNGTAENDLGKGSQEQKCVKHVSWKETILYLMAKSSARPASVEVLGQFALVACSLIA